MIEQVTYDSNDGDEDEVDPMVVGEGNLLPTREGSRGQDRSLRICCIV